MSELIERFDVYPDGPFNVERDDCADGVYVAVYDLVSWIKRQPPQYSALLAALGEDVEEPPVEYFTREDFIQWHTEFFRSKK